MSFIKSFQKRYTTKKFNSDKKIESHKINELKQILQLSPSSINSQPWKFIFVSDAKAKSELAKASFFNDQKVEKCDTLVVFSRIDDIAIFEKQIEENLPQAAVDYYNSFIKQLPEEKIKAWFDKQVYLALGVFLSACANMEIDSTPMEGVDPAAYNKILNLNGYNTLMAVAIGYRDEQDANQPNLHPKSRVDIHKIVEVV